MRYPSEGAGLRGRVLGGSASGIPKPGQVTGKDLLSDRVAYQAAAAVPSSWQYQVNTNEG